jgi:hypothetical protein
MTEHDWEPVRGLPGRLPAGEHIIWQGSPDWRLLARTLCHVRLVGAYFVVLVALALVGGALPAALATAASGALCLGLLALFAWGVARTTIYTLTNRRIVLRVGIALPKCVNLPLHLITAADLRAVGNGCGEIALTLGGTKRVGYALLWPHIRPWKLRDPQPMLRALPEVDEVAATLARACAAVAPIERPAPAAAEVPMPVGAIGVAA